MTETQPTTQALSAIRDSLNGTTPLGSMSWWIQGEVLASVANYWMLNAADPNVTAICQSTIMAGGVSPSPGWRCMARARLKARSTSRI